MTTHEHPIAMLVWSTGASSIRLTRARTVALETIQSLSRTAGDVLFAYSMTGSAISTIAVIAAPHLQALLGCLFHGRG